MNVVVRQLKPIKHSEISSQMTINLPHTTENTTMQLQEINEVVNILVGGVEALTDDLQRLSTDSISHQHTLDPLVQDLSILKISIQEQNSFLDGVKMNQDILRQDLASMEQKVNNMKSSSYDGTFVWKITNVQEKMSEEFIFCLVE
jgi:chromosome segregation ATPase